LFVGCSPSFTRPRSKVVQLRIRGLSSRVPAGNTVFELADDFLFPRKATMI
jgi:hypothetical protein